MVRPVMLQGSRFSGWWRRVAGVGEIYPAPTMVILAIVMGL